MQSPFFFWLVGYIRGWSSRLPRYDFLAFSRMIMFFSLTLIFSVLTCCWAFQYNSLIRSPILAQNAFCLALPFHTPPTCLYTPKAHCLYTPGNESQSCLADARERSPILHPMISLVWASSAIGTHCLFPLWSTNDHNSSIWTVSFHDCFWHYFCLLLYMLDNICSHSFAASLLTHLLFWLFRLRGFSPITINLPMRWCLCLLVSTVDPPQTVFHSLDIYGFVFLCALSHFS